MWVRPDKEILWKTAVSRQGKTPFGLLSNEQAKEFFFAAVPDEKYIHDRFAIEIHYSPSRAHTAIEILDTEGSDCVLYFYNEKEIGDFILAIQQAVEKAGWGKESKDA